MPNNEIHEKTCILDVDVVEVHCIGGSNMQTEKEKKINSERERLLWLSRRNIVPKHLEKLSSRYGIDFWLSRLR